MLTTRRGLAACALIAGGALGPVSLARGEVNEALQPAPAAHEARAAAPIAPALTATLLRRDFEEQLERLLAAIPADARARLAGTYVAFDEDGSDASALAACDDDGDPVVVVTEAMVQLARTASQAMAADESMGTHKLAEYATWIARSQRDGARLLPPAPGFFEGARAPGPEREPLERTRFKEVATALLAHELEHLLSGDVACPHPSATRERGDDVWTTDEHRAALGRALQGYARARVLAADVSAAALLMDTLQSTATATRFLAAFEIIERTSGPRFRPTYLRLHPDTPARLRAISSGAGAWRDAHRARRAAGP